MQVRQLLVRRAADARHDPPLLSTCARDIAARCANVTDGTRVLG